MHGWRLALVVLALAGACTQAPEPAGGVPPAASISEGGAAAAPASEDRDAAAAVQWPQPDTNADAARCAYQYPDELADRANAFDATVTGVDVGEYSPDHAARPATVTVSVNEVFNGRQEGTAVLKTWDFSLPENPEHIVGARILASAGPTMDLMGCGFTQPYSKKTADMWRDVFTSSAQDDGVALRRCVEERTDGEQLEAAFATTGNAVKEWLDEIDGPGHQSWSRVGESAVSLCYFQGVYPVPVPAGANQKYTRRVAMVPSRSRDVTLFISPKDGEPTAPPGAVRVDGD